jgi:outer membrane protein insertion porin family
MRNIVLILLLLVVGYESAAQFRRSRERTTGADANLNYTNPAELVIAGIEVTGLNILDKNAMVSLTGLRVGDKIKIPGDAITSAIRKLWKHGLVGDVSINVQKVEGDNVWLEIHLAERPRLTNFYFTGINRSQESSLKEELTLIRGKIVNDAMLRNTEVAVKKYFVKKGFLNTEVKIIQERDTLNRDGIRLKISVNPNSKVKINKIGIANNESISDAKIKGRMKKTKEHPRFTLHRMLISKALSFKPSHIKDYFSSSYDVSWLDVKGFFSDHVKLNIFQGSKFIQSEFEEDKKKVIEFYNTKGYRDAEITVDTVYSYNKKAINIDLAIDEGPKYYFRNIIWTGNYIHTDKTLNAILGIKKGDIYNRELIARKLTFNPKGPDISGLYMDDGYLFFRIKDVEVAVAGDSIDVEMRIFEGDQATINEVTIAGNDRTSDHVIRRRDCQPYPVKNSEDQISSVRSKSLVSSAISIRKPSDKISNLIRLMQPLILNGRLKNNPMTRLNSPEAGVVPSVLWEPLVLTFNNFSLRNIPHPKKWRPLPVGDGQRLSLRVQANGRNFQNYSISFTEALVGWTQTSITFCECKQIYFAFCWSRRNQLL